MRTVSAATTDAWLSGDYVGAKRPMVRASIQRLDLCIRSYSGQTYSSVVFGQANRPLELPNIKDVKWQRSVDGGVGTCTLTLYNTDPLPIGQIPTDSDFDQPGAYSPKRGIESFSSRWGHGSTGWQDWLVPDRIIRTYEGYGFDIAQIPELDPNLYLSGTWLIDDVTFTTDGLITVECRDVGRVLLDQILFPPVVPMASYPLYFTPYYLVDNPDIVTTTTVGGAVKVSYETSSNRPYIGNSGNVHGHVGPDAFDGSNSSYWLSIGNASPNAGYSFEYIQGKFTSHTIYGASAKVWGGGYRCYVSVFADGKWQGDSVVPYDPNNPVSAPNGSNIRYVASKRVSSNGTATFVFKKPIKNATKVRFCFTDLGNSGIGPYPYRAGVREVTVQGQNQVTTVKDGGKHQEPFTSPPGVHDYSEIVKHLLAWAGFWWPQDPLRGFTTSSDGTRHDVHAASTDPLLKNGRVWGDIESAGTAPQVAIPVDVWDKKPVMDGVTYVRDILGYIFFIDETGGAVFRSPNIWNVGNWIGDGGPNAGRTTSVVTIDERQTLMTLSAKLSSRSIREKVFVGNVSGQIAAMSHGFNPYPSGLRRVGGWTDQHFKTVAECQIMADLVTLRQLFTYRTDRITIAGHPGIQIDDQVRIYERISEEGYLHYVTGITMNWSAETGKYTYDLDTHWLGDTTFTNWTFNPVDLSKEAQAYLRAMGKI